MPEGALYTSVKHQKVNWDFSRSIYEDTKPYVVILGLLDFFISGNKCISKNHSLADVWLLWYIGYCFGEVDR